MGGEGRRKKRVSSQTDIVVSLLPSLSPQFPFFVMVRYSCVSCKGPKEGSTSSGEPRFIEYQFPYEEIEPGKASLPFIRLYQPLFIDLVFHPRRSVRSIKALFIEFPPVNYFGIIPASNHALRKEFRFFSFLFSFFLFSNANNRPRFFKASLTWRTYGYFCYPIG